MVKVEDGREHVLQVGRGPRFHRGGELGVGLEEAAGLGQVGGEGAAAEQNVLEQVAKRFGAVERNGLRALVADDDHQMVVKIFAHAAWLLLHRRATRVASA